jgi:hypothetical protein
MALTFELLRAEDLLALRVNTTNLDLDVSKPNDPRLAIIDSSQPAYITIEFPPQSILEKTYFEVAAHVADPTQPNKADDPLDPAGAVPCLMANSSRLVFKLSKGTNSVPFRMDNLLDWSKWQLVLSPTALGEPVPPPIVAPSHLETAIELPFNLILAPATRAGWVHSRKRITHAGRSELWHTRLGRYVKATTAGSQARLVEANESQTVPLRAIWSNGFMDHGALPPNGGVWLATMSQRDRVELVILTSGVQGYQVLDDHQQPINWTPNPIQASRLFLSSLGGWLSSRGSWPKQPFYKPTGGGAAQQLNISEWVHVATQARDHYVKIVYEGYLYPFGHRAALVKVTERKIVPPDGATVTYPTAYLKQHMYVVVREPVKSYSTSPYAHEGREMPFWRSVRIRATVTPDIDEPSFITQTDANTQTNDTLQSFWIDVSNRDYPFHITATDLAGKEVDLEGALIFMDEGETRPDLLQQAYSGAGTRRLFAVNAVKVTYADPNAGDTTLKTNAIRFDTQLLQNGPPYADAPFIPTLAEADVTIPVVEMMMGTSLPVRVQLYRGYLFNKLDPHAGVFAEVSDAPPTLTFSADKSGGFATPNLSLTALSARKGLVAGKADDAAAGLIAPLDFFSDLSAKLFGTVPLQALIPVDASGKAPADVNAPEIRTQLKPNATNPDTLVIKVSWSPRLQNYDKDPVHVDFEPDAALKLTAQLVRSLKSSQATSDIEGELTSFTVSLLGVIGIKFDALKFRSKNSSKMIVKAELPASHPIHFMGPLEFVQTLADVLPPGLFGGKGPSIALKSDRITVSYTLGIPPIAVGVFSLEHISITAGLDLPYLDGKPGFEFAFAKRSSPFLLTVECLGGGGFVHLILDADGVQMVEGALEFGAQLALSFGVASGAVHVMAGIYFQLKGSDSDLTGFVDVCGEVSVLGIISISLDLNLSLSYQVQSGKKVVTGRATLTVSISIMFFSMSVQITMERSFAANPGDPRLGNVISLANWQDYVAAFA